jgi:uncharacterized protein
VRSFGHRLDRCEHDGASPGGLRSALRPRETGRAVAVAGACLAREHEPRADRRFRRVAAARVFDARGALCYLKRADPIGFSGCRRSLVGRVVLIVLVILAVIFLIRGFGRSRARGDDVGAAGRRLPDQRMVQCAHCGVYVPESAAVEAAGLHYCSDEHRRLSEK